MLRTTVQAHCGGIDPRVWETLGSDAERDFYTIAGSGDPVRMRRARQAILSELARRSNRRGGEKKCVDASRYLHR
jgi:hypothetical protein